MSLTIYPHDVPLETTSDGVVCVKGTRVTLDTLIGAFQDGHSAEEIVMQYTSVSLADVYAVIAYYLHEQETVDAYLADYRQKSALLRATMRQQQDHSHIRERLLARRKALKSAEPIL
jgi:uncharacterized protein (DUF433 family)